MPSSLKRFLDAAATGQIDPIGNGMRMYAQQKAQEQAHELALAKQAEDARQFGAMLPIHQQTANAGTSRAQTYQQAEAAKPGAAALQYNRDLTKGLVGNKALDQATVAQHIGAEGTVDPTQLREFMGHAQQTQRQSVLNDKGVAQQQQGDITFNNERRMLPLKTAAELAKEKALIPLRTAAAVDQATQLQPINVETARQKTVNTTGIRAEHEGAAIDKSVNEAAAQVHDIFRQARARGMLGLGGEQSLETLQSRLIQAIGQPNHNAKPSHEDENMVRGQELFSIPGVHAPVRGKGLLHSIYMTNGDLDAAEKAAMDLLRAKSRSLGALKKGDVTAP